MLMYIKYLTDSGKIHTAAYKLSHNLVHDSQLELLYELLEKYNNNICYIRDESDFKLTYNDSVLDTSEFYIEIPKNMNILQLDYPSFGSLNACITQNIVIDLGKMLQDRNGYNEHVNIKLEELDLEKNFDYLFLTDIRPGGFKNHVYKLEYTFISEGYDEYQEHSRKYINEQISNMSNSVYLINGSEMNANGKVVKDLSFENIDLLKEQISLLLSSNLDQAKISNLKITYINQENLKLE